MHHNPAALLKWTWNIENVSNVHFLIPLKNVPTSSPHAHVIHVDIDHRHT